MKYRRVPSSAEHTASAIKNWCAEQGVDFEFLPVNGRGHPQVRVMIGRQSRKMSFAATPSDKRRGALNAVSQLRRVCREIGWKGKEEPMTNLVSTRVSKFDAQKPSTGPAGQVKIMRPETPAVVAGIVIPSPIMGQLSKHHLNWSGEESLRVKERNEAMRQAYEAGAKVPVIHEAVEDAGWEMSLGSVSVNITRARRERGEPHRRAATQRKTETLPAEPPVLKTRCSDVDEFALAIAAAIAPLIGDLKAKAEKWDAIKGLVSED